MLIFNFSPVAVAVKSALESAMCFEGSDSY